MLQRMTIIGVLLSFRSLAQEALNDVSSTCMLLFTYLLPTPVSQSYVICLFQVLEQRIPFLLSSIKDFQQHVPSGQDSMVRRHFFSHTYTYSRLMPMVIQITTLHISSLYIFMLTMKNDFLSITFCFVT